MHLTKNKLHQLFFYILITLMLIFNGSNYDFYAQFNFIFVALLFLVCQIDINYKSHIKYFLSHNKKILIIYLIFLTYLIFQILPFPTEIIKILSPSKYQILVDLEHSNFFSSISLDYSRSFVNFLNYFSLLIYFIIFKTVFYKEKHLLRFYLYLIFAGFVASLVAVYFFLIGNPDFLFILNSGYSTSATGFFINRTVFACFLNLSFLCGLEYLFIINCYSKNKSKYFYRKIYIRLFLLFMTIGIITSFSKIGNFLFFLLIIIYFFKLFLKKNENKYLFYTILFIVIFDIFVLGFFFGGTKLFERFSFLKDELVAYNEPFDSYNSLKRADIFRFSIYQFTQFKFFGYGTGAFEVLFKVFNINNSLYYANHAHSDLIEFLGELGIIGFSILSYLILLIVKKINYFDTKLIFLIIYFIILLLFDFSFHIFFIQLIFSLLLSFNIKKKNIN